MINRAAWVFCAIACRGMPSAADRTEWEAIGARSQTVQNLLILVAFSRLVQVRAYFKIIEKSSCIRVVRSVIYVPAFGATGQVAQSVEQGIENPRVGGSSPSLTTIRIREPLERAAFSSAKWACSSVGQSARLIIVRSQVRTLSGPPPLLNKRPTVSHEPVERLLDTGN